MASNNNQNGWLSGLGIGFGDHLNSVIEQQSSSSDMNQFEQIDRSTATSNTLKRNPKMELTRNDLLKLVTYFEGELQARDIAIAALKSEKLKQVVNVGRYRPAVMADPYIALLRDSFADNSKPLYSEREMVQTAELQQKALEQLALQQRRAHQHMVNILRDAEAKHKKVIQELEEEKCKHEHDTAQGDDITYGLEMERTRLRQELEMERTARKKLEKEVKRQLDLADEERARQKQIVLLLLAERKKIIIKYIEERKRSEDLAQILSEEKSRIDQMAEGLEEESKKSLRMEAELEKQFQIFDAEKRNLKMLLASKESRCQEMDLELQKLRHELEVLRSRVIPSADGAPMTSSVTKVVQPTATVSSVPVSGPTTGIAQSVIPGQQLKQTAVQPTVPAVKGQSSPRATPPAAKTTGLPFGASPPQTLPKKGVVGRCRGVPPPIPPNKPVITSGKTPVRKSEGEGEKKKVEAAGGKEAACAATGEQRAGAGIEMLGQELADFQQMFVTMATGSVKPDPSKQLICAVSPQVM